MISYYILIVCNTHSFQNRLNIVATSCEITRKINSKSPMNCYPIYIFIVCANNKQSYSKVYILFISLLYCYYKVNIFPNIIVLVPSTIFQTYDITLCGCSHMSLHHPRKRKRKKKIKRKEILNQEKQIKEKKNISIQVYHDNRVISLQNLQILGHLQQSFLLSNLNSFQFFITEIFTWSSS